MDLPRRVLVPSGTVVARLVLRDCLEAGAGPCAPGKAFSPSLQMPRWWLGRCPGTPVPPQGGKRCWSPCSSPESAGLAGCSREALSTAEF